MPITITGTLGTDESAARSITSSFSIDAVDFFDTTQPLGTTYETIAASTDAPTATFWTIIENTGDVEVVYRITLDGTNYVILPLPVGAVSIVPPGFFTVGTKAMFAVTDVAARALSGSSEVRVHTFYVL